MHLNKCRRNSTEGQEGMRDGGNRLAKEDPENPKRGEREVHKQGVSPGDQKGPNTAGIFQSPIITKSTNIGKSGAIN